MHHVSHHYPSTLPGAILSSARGRVSEDYLASCRGGARDGATQGWSGEQSTRWASQAALGKGTSEWPQLLKLIGLGWNMLSLGKWSNMISLRIRLLHKINLTWSFTSHFTRGTYPRWLKCLPLSPYFTCRTHTNKDWTKNATFNAKFQNDSDP